MNLIKNYKNPKNRQNQTKKQNWLQKRELSLKGLSQKHYANFVGEKNVKTDVKTVATAWQST